MNLTWICAILSLLVTTNGIPEDQLEKFISLTKYGYEDSCSKSAESEWAFITKPTNETRQSWENTVTDYALYKINQVNETNDQKVEKFPSSSLKYAYNVVIKPGDALLDPEDFRRLVSFVGQAEQFRLTGHCVTGNKKRSRQEIERQLARNGNPKDKLSAWSAWHRALSPMATNYSHILHLVKKAAAANGKKSVREYWEMLSGYENGYEHAKREWSKISWMHEKILIYVNNRLNKKYADKIEKNTLPAHLLGSLRSYDWTNLALSIVPYSDVTYEIRKNLLEKEIVGSKLYEKASTLGNAILKTVPQSDFWKESNFRGRCPSHLINLCRQSKMRISTCSEASIANFISAHKNVAKIVVTQMSHDTEPILNLANRYSALDEGIGELFGVLSMSQAWLDSRGLIDNNTDLDQVRIVSLMITALDVLPRMAYYLAADMWRIDTMENKTSKDNNLASSWWKYRMEYEGISSSIPDLPTFLDDDYITSNRPYLSKFMGTLLGFQMYEYLMESTEMRYETIGVTPFANHRRFAKMIREGFADSWTEIIKKYLDFDEVSADKLLEYFSPLIDYIDVEAELDENIPIPEQQEKYLDNLAEIYRKKFNAPSTTTTTSTTSTTTTPKPIGSKSSGESMIRDKEKMEAPKSSKTENSTRTTEIAKTIDISPMSETNETAVKVEIASPEVTETDEVGPKTNTSKAVWAVAAVLIAIVTICIIAIFGRRRCRKAPKNRRYV